ncbi:MAG TPA: 3-oxoacyl-ACP reductase family protein [Thermoplasmata archaeon]|nr:3-oxoacyl-ACP reductase family protein [Thermoplasmata archaeon]
MAPQSFDLTGKVALVTGAGRGIGKAIALALARAGADVAVNYVEHPDQAEAVAKEVRGMGRNALAIRADVSDRVEAYAMVDEVVSGLGGIDILVNNAGILTFEPFLELREETWDRVLDVNLKGQFLVAQAAARQMALKKRGRIINIASIASGQVGVGYPNIAHYCASKGGVIAMTEVMALELSPLGINVNAIAPGMIASDMTKDMLGDANAMQALLARVPKRRIGTPEDVASLAVFLASDEADYCTGATFYVDGGWLAG